MTPTARRSDSSDMEHVAAVVDLAERHSPDLDVVLMWAKPSDRLWVVVTHRRSGRTARIDAPARNALDVFNHPFAYAGRAAA
jgi:hypothetical protein